MKKFKYFLFFLLLVLFAIVYLGQPTPEEQARIDKAVEKRIKEKRKSVASWWKNYDPDLKQRIDKSDCNKLQVEFNTAQSNSDRQRARTGEGNLNLIEYIDQRMQQKGCY